MPHSRKCYGCEVVKAAKEFAVDAAHVSGRKRLCLACDRAKAARYYAANRDRRLAQMRARHAQMAAASPPRLCRACGESAASRRHHYCDTCRDGGTS